MPHPREIEARRAKARKLADVILSNMKESGLDLKRSAEAARGLDTEAWAIAAAQAGTRMPSLETMNVVIELLLADAKAMAMVEVPF